MNCTCVVHSFLFKIPIFATTSALVASLFIAFLLCIILWPLTNLYILVLLLPPSPKYPSSDQNLSSKLLAFRLMPWTSWTTALVHWLILLIFLRNFNHPAKPTFCNLLASHGPAWPWYHWILYRAWQCGKEKTGLWSIYFYLPSLLCPWMLGPESPSWPLPSLPNRRVLTTSSFSPVFGQRSCSLTSLRCFIVFAHYLCLSLAELDWIKPWSIQLCLYLHLNVQCKQWIQLDKLAQWN